MSGVDALYGSRRKEGGDRVGIKRLLHFKRLHASLQSRHLIMIIVQLHRIRGAIACIIESVVGQPLVSFDVSESIGSSGRDFESIRAPIGVGPVQLQRDRIKYLLPTLNK